jgi:hypothetical protein
VHRGLRRRRGELRVVPGGTAPGPVDEISPTVSPDGAEAAAVRTVAGSGSR